MYKLLFPKSLLVLLSSISTLSCLTPVPVKVEGMAMRPTFQDGDRLLMSNDISKLERFDIIYFKFPKDETKAYIKRIVGLPGERIEIADGLVKINGKALTESFLDQEYNQSGSSIPETSIPSEHYFVLGDNRDNSSDSRYWGTVARSLILGKYSSTYYNSNRK